MFGHTLMHLGFVAVVHLLLVSVFAVTSKFVVVPLLAAVRSADADADPASTAQLAALWAALWHAVIVAAALHAHRYVPPALSRWFAMAVAFIAAVSAVSRGIDAVNALGPRVALEFVWVWPLPAVVLLRASRQPGFVRAATIAVSSYIGVFYPALPAPSDARAFAVPNLLVFAAACVCQHLVTARLSHALGLDVRPPALPTWPDDPLGSLKRCVPLAGVLFLHMHVVAIVASILPPEAHPGVPLFAMAAVSLAALAEFEAVRTLEDARTGTITVLWLFAMTFKTAADSHAIIDEFTQAAGHVPAPGSG